MVSRHYMDLKFGLGKGHEFRTKIDMEQIAKLVLSWPWIGYNVSKCSLVFIPCAKCGRFLLIVLDLKSKIVSILDPFPNQYGLDMYKHILRRISDMLRLVMQVAYPRWNEDVEATCYYVLLFMCAWDDKGLRSTVCTDAYELRKELLIHV
ncbi:hypothetical protein BS78_K064800 [Paspalum vaginatum]|uniref:Uncharacterized protein n=1 Tax=Paspalum vaginatum TaxID=158149 RepID=A0A9W8CEA8_9POAL|nr:hypothetical protein BS78_K064800 [Paspalum vaginatum]